MPVAQFERFAIDMPPEAVGACSHSGDCDLDVRAWAPEIGRPAEATAEAVRAELVEYGAWEAEQLADDAANWERIVWIAACNLRDDGAA